MKHVADPQTRHVRARRNPRAAQVLLVKAVPLFRGAAFERAGVEVRADLVMVKGIRVVRVIYTPTSREMLRCARVCGQLLLATCCCTAASTAVRAAPGRRAARQVACASISNA